MAITEQSNSSLKEIAETILDKDSFCICGHVRPDGDCIGSTLALRLALIFLGKEVSILLADSEKVDEKFQILDGWDSYIPAKDFNGSADVFVSVDVPNNERIGKYAANIKSKCPLSITIDHHENPKRVSTLSYTDPDIASTTMLIWELLGYLNAEKTKEIATCCLLGMMTDSGSFCYQNTTALTFEMASQMTKCGASSSEIANAVFENNSLAQMHLEVFAINHLELLCDGQIAISWVSLNDLHSCNATLEDCESLINIIRSIAGVKIACMLREEHGSVRGSLRAKGNDDISVIAREFGGGGHKAASGFTLNTSLGKSLDIVRDRLKDYFE